MAKPLGLDFWIGLPEAIEPRVAPMTPYAYKPEQAVTPFLRDLATDKQSIASLFYFNVGAILAHRRRRTPARATPPRSARPTASPTRAGWPACTLRSRKEAASWSTPRR